MDENQFLTGDTLMHVCEQHQKMFELVLQNTQAIAAQDIQIKTICKKQDVLIAKIDKLTSDGGDVIAELRQVSADIKKDLELFKISEDNVHAKTNGRLSNLEESVRRILRKEPDYDIIIPPPKVEPQVVVNVDHSIEHREDGMVKSTFKIMWEEFSKKYLLPIVIGLTLWLLLWGGFKWLIFGEVPTVFKSPSQIEVKVK